jgi:hypothetical protein
MTDLQDGSTGHSGSTVPCPNCGARMSGSDLSGHLVDCEKSIRCPDCNRQVKAFALERHKENECDPSKGLVECSECSAWVRKDRMARHTRKHSRKRAKPKQAKRSRGGKKAGKWRRRLPRAAGTGSTLARGKDCEARTQDGRRCTRRAKERVGRRDLCIQHARMTEEEKPLRTPRRDQK